MRSKALAGYLFLLFLVVLLIVFLVKGKKLESFFVDSEGCPTQEHPPIVVDEEGNVSGGPERPPNYNPNDYHMCKNIGWVNNNSPYKTVPNQAWYDAEQQCKDDYLCNSFTIYGDPDTTTSNIDYYTSKDATEISAGTWENRNKPNFYVKSTSPCITNKTITYYNENSDGNLQSNDSGIPYRYVNDFVTATRGFLNDNNAYRIAKDSGTIGDYMVPQ